MFQMDNKDFCTADIVLAAFLKVQRYPLVEIVKNGNKGTFVFSGVPDSVINEYDLGQAKVEPKMLNAEIKALTTAARR
jgi:hypothetical protein